MKFYLIIAAVSPKFAKSIGITNTRTPIYNKVTGKEMDEKEGEVLRAPDSHYQVLRMIGE